MSDRHRRLGTLLAACLFLAPARFARASSDVVFATSVDNPSQARKATLLVDSLRRFGGPLADAPVHVVVDSVLEETASLWNRPGITAHALEGEPGLRRFPYARKVLAAAQVERLVEESARTLVWLDAETLVLSSPTALVLRGNATFAVRPVFLRNAVALPEGAPLDAWWTRIASEAGRAVVAAERDWIPAAPPRTHPGTVPPRPARRRPGGPLRGPLRASPRLARPRSGVGRPRRVPPCGGRGDGLEPGSSRRRGSE